MKTIVTFLLAIFCVVNQAQSQNIKQAPVPSSSITVEADGWTSLEPDFIRFTVIVEELKENAVKAMQAVDYKISKIKTALNKSGIKDLKIRTRDIDFFPAKAHVKPILPAKALRARKIVAIETSEVNKAATIADQILNAGGTSIQDITSFVLDGHEEKLKAIATASRRANQKAKLIAKSLGVKLGPLIESNTIDDPSAPILLRQRESGKNIAYGDKDIHVIVSQRYSIF